MADILGFRSMLLNAGPNIVTSPFASVARVRITVDTLASNTVTLAQPGMWTPHEFVPRDGFAQTILLVIRDQSESPGCQGNWWPVIGHTNATFTVDTRGEDLTDILSPGDQVELRPLTSVRDLFGSGADLKIIPDTDLVPSPAQEDIIRTMKGDRLDRTIFYHQGAAGVSGWYVNGVRIGDGSGSTITFGPAEPFVFYRRQGSSGLNLVVGGAVQTTRLSVYLQAGANPVGNPFPVPMPLATSNLLGTDWVDDQDFDAIPGVDDFVREIVGTAFRTPIYHHGGSLGAPGWYVNGRIDASYALAPASGHMLMLGGSQPRVWRMAVPFIP